MEPQINVTEIVKSPFYNVLNFFGLVDNSLKDNPNTTQSQLINAIGFSTKVKVYDEETIVNIIQDSPKRIKYIIDPPELLQEVAVLTDWKVLSSIENPTKSTQLAAIEQHSQALKLIENPIKDKDLQAAAIFYYGIAALKLIDNPTEQHYIDVLKEHPYDIWHIENPSPILRKTAIANAPGLIIREINNPTNEEIILAITSTELPEELGKDLLTNNPNLSDEIKILLVQKAISNIDHIQNNQTEILEKAGYILNNGDINSIPKNIGLISLSEENRHDLLNGERVFQFFDNNGPYIDGDNLTIYFEENYNTLEIYKVDVRNEGGSINFYHKTVNVFKSDTNLAEIQQEENSIVGKITFHDSGEVMHYETNQKYLDAITKEMDSNPNGFTTKTLKREPELLKKVDDILYGEFGIENPNNLNHYIDIVQKESNPTDNKGNDLTDRTIDLTDTTNLHFDMEACKKRLLDNKQNEPELEAKTKDIKL